jgi:hypothetical protein
VLTWPKRTEGKPSHTLMGNMRRLSSTVAGLVLLALFLICAPQPAHAQLMETTMGAYPLIIGKSIHLYHLPINETNDYSYVIFELDGELRNVSHGACTNTSLITSTCKLDPPFVGTGIVYGAFDDSPSKVPVAFANRVYQSSGTEPIVIPGHYGDPEQDVIFEGPKGFQSQVTCARNDEGTVLTCPPLGAVTYSGLYQVVVPSNGFIPATYEAWALVGSHFCLNTTYFPPPLSHTVEPPNSTHNHRKSSICRPRSGPFNHIVQWLWLWRCQSDGPNNCFI